MKTLSLKILVEELDILERKISFERLTYNELINAQKRVDEIYIKFGLTNAQADSFIKTIH